MNKREITLFDVESVEVHRRLRPVSEEAVAKLMTSMSTLGLQTPITIRYYEERPGNALSLFQANRVHRRRCLGRGRVVRHPARATGHAGNPDRACRPHLGHLRLPGAGQHAQGIMDTVAA